MKLAIVATHPVQYFAPLYRELSKLCDLTVFYGHRATPEQQAAAGFGTAFDWDIDVTSGCQHYFLKNVSKDPHASRFGGCDTPEIGARLAEGEFDAVLTVGWYSKMHLQAIWAARRQGRAVLVRSDSQLGLQPSRVKRAVKALTYPVLMRLFDGIVVVGARAQAYARAYGYPEERLFLAPHAIDTERFALGATAEAGSALRAKHGIPVDRQLVLFAGKLISFKRPLDVVEAVAQLRQSGRDVGVLIAGSGPLEGEVLARAEALNVAVHGLGFVNQMAMPAAYAAADVLALTSTGRETWGLVANEALASGCPVVLSDATGCAQDLAAPGRVGRVFHCGNVDHLAQVLAEVLASPPTCSEIKLTSEAFTLTNAAKGIVAACQASVSRRRHGIAASPDWN